MQLCQILIANPVAIVLLYRPPKHNTEFINEFITAHDIILLLGGFNIHVCCASVTLSMEFLNLIESFDLVQLVSGPTHLQAQTLFQTLQLATQPSLIICLSFSLYNILVKL